MSSLKPDHRRRELAQIHIAKKTLGIADDVYRDKIRALSNGQFDSAGDLDWRGRKTLLDYMRACGHQSTPAPAKRLIPNTPKWRKVYSLWQQLANAGKVNSRASKSLLAFCLKNAGVDKIEWVSDAHVYAITEALKSWLIRK